MRTLHLTSPHLYGPDVANIQSLLHQHGYLDAKIDSEYGPMTAQAVYRAKYWLGYRKPDQVAGDLFLNYLRGSKKVTPIMALIRKRRLTKKSKPGQFTMAEKALNNARKHLGEKEYPAGSNRIQFASLWYGIIGSWCAMAVTRWYVDAGSKAFVRGKQYAYVPYIVADARAGRNNLTVTHSPQAGDVVCYDWPGESPGLADHTGLFEKWMDRSAGTFYAIEGNTSLGNDSNGGEVMRRNRTLSEVQCFVHVGK